MLGCDWFIEIEGSNRQLSYRTRTPNINKKQAIEEWINSINIKFVRNLLRTIARQKIDDNGYGWIIAAREIKLEQKIILDIKTKIKWSKTIRYDKDSNYLKLTSSFYSSKEWKQFRLSWLKEHPECFKCGKTDEVMQVHHLEEYKLVSTILYEGFLEPLRDKNRFRTLCYRCHAIKHGRIIIATREQVERWPQSFISYKGQMIEIQPPEGFKGVIRIWSRDLYALSLDERKKLMEDEGWV